MQFDQVVEPTHEMCFGSIISFGTIACIKGGERNDSTKKTYIRTTGSKGGTHRDTHQSGRQYFTMCVFCLDHIGYGAMVTLLFSAAMGSLASVIIAKSKRLMIASITAASYYLSLLGINILFFDGKLQGMWETALVVIAGTGLVILGGLKERKPHKNRAAKTKIVKLYKKH